MLIVAKIEQLVMETNGSFITGGGCWCPNGTGPATAVSLFSSASSARCSTALSVVPAEGEAPVAARRVFTGSWIRDSRRGRGRRDWITAVGKVHEGRVDVGENQFVGLLADFVTTGLGLAPVLPPGAGSPAVGSDNRPDLSTGGAPPTRRVAGRAERTWRTEAAATPAPSYPSREEHRWACGAPCQGGQTRLKIRQD